MVKIGFEVGTQRLDNKAAPGYFEQISCGGYLVISCFRLIFFKYSSLGRAERHHSI